MSRKEMFASGMVILDDEDEPDAAQLAVQKSRAFEERQMAWTRAAFDVFDADGR